MVNGTNYNNGRWHKIISIMVKSKKGKVPPSLSENEKLSNLMNLLAYLFLQDIAMRNDKYLDDYQK